MCVCVGVYACVYRRLWPLTIVSLINTFVAISSLEGLNLPMYNALKRLTSLVTLIMEVCVSQGGWGVGLNSHLIVCARVCVCVCACACACVCVCTLRLYWQKIKINSKCLIWYRDSDFLVVFVVFVNL